MQDKQPFKEILECLKGFPEILSCKIIIDVTSYDWFQIMKINSTNFRINNKWRNKDTPVETQSLLLEANIKESELIAIEASLKEAFKKTKTRLDYATGGTICWQIHHYKRDIE